jgi:hypothetical protein
VKEGPNLNVNTLNKNPIYCSYKGLSTPNNAMTFFLNSSRVSGGSTLAPKEAVNLFIRLVVGSIGVVRVMINAVVRPINKTIKNLINL